MKTDSQTYITKLEEDNKLLKSTLMWVYTEVWPLVHGLTSRETLKKKFLTIPNIISPDDGKTPF